MGNLNITTVATSQSNKETTINDADARLENALTDALTTSLAGGNVTLTADQYQTHMVFKTSGNAVPRDLTLPAKERFAIFYNGGSALLTIKCGSGSITLKTLGYCIVYTDGTTNGIEKLDVTTGGSFAFTSLVDAPANYTSAARKIVRVNAAATAVEFVTMGYTLAFYQENIMTNAQMVYKFIATVPFTLPSGLSGSYATSEVASAGNVHFDIKKNGSDVGDITFNTSTTGSFTLGSDQSFAAGDVLTITGPATADASLAGVAASLLGYLT